jgi:hypothetical protein
LVPPQTKANQKKGEDGVRVMNWRFLSDDSGAVKADWVVITASVVGLGLTSAGAVHLGTGNLGNAIEAALTDAQIASLRWQNLREFVSQNFANGDFSGWSLARAGTFGAWGAMLGPFGYDTFTNPLTYAVNLPEGITNGLITFDLIIADSWDGHNPQWSRPDYGDTLRLIVDGQVISTEVFGGVHQDRQSTIQVGGSTFNVSMTMVDRPQSSVGGSHWSDERWQVRVEAVNAPQSFQLGFSATTHQPLDDESFGIQNFRVAGN